jgi:Transport and Golgi organisation 2
MCTVSWIHHDGGYQLLCNRDERRTRRPAHPPRVRESRGTRLIAPVDGDHGGSWIAVNEFGLSLCLLNRDRAGESHRSSPRASRGLLVLELADCATRARLRGRLSHIELFRFQPFTLAALEPERPALLIEWNGRECSITDNGEPEMPLTSSAADPAGVEAARRALFRSLAAAAPIDADLLYRFHASRHPTAGAYGPCMQREDAETVSFSRIVVTDDAAEFYYHPGPPGAHLPLRAGDALRIERLRSAA